MSGFFERYFRKDEIKNNDESLTTDLLMNESELKRLSVIVKSWRITIGGCSDEDSHRLFYRNLIKLTSVYKTPRERITFVVMDSSIQTSMMVERLRNSGFTLFEECTDSNVLCEPTESYGQRQCVFSSFHVAGMQYHVSEGSEMWSRLEAGTLLRLVAEPDNVHDVNAVAVYFDDQKIGYIPKGDNGSIAALLNAGWSHVLESRVVKSDKTASFHTRILVNVYVLRNETCDNS